MIAPAVENDKVVSQNLKTKLPPDAAAPLWDCKRHITASLLLIEHGSHENPVISG